MRVEESTEPVQTNVPESTTKELGSIATEGHHDQKPPAEFEFHQQRFRNLAEKYQARSRIQKIIDWKRGDRWESPPTAVDFAHAEALHDDEYFDLKKDPEYLAWQENLQVVMKHLLEKRDPSNHEAQKRKVVMLIMGGGMKSPYAVGQTIGLHEIGLGNAFDAVVGISGGAGPATYFLGGPEQSRVGGDIWYNEATTKNFIDFKRVKQIMDVGYIIDAASHGEKSVDFKAVEQSPTELYVVATDPETYEAKLINAKTAKPNMAAAVHASMSAPLVYNEAIEVNGGRYIDGAFDPMPIQKIIDELHPDDILILPNTPFMRMESLEVTPGEIIFSNILKAAGSVSSVASIGTMEKFLSAKNQLRASLEWIQKQNNVDIGILWPPESGLTNLGTDPDKIKSGILQGARDLIDQFGEVQPEVVELYKDAHKQASDPSLAR